MRQMVQNKNIIIAVFLLALSLRLIHIFNTYWIFNGIVKFTLSSSARSVFDSSDVKTYEEIASGIARGTGLGVPFHPPAVPVLLAFLYKVFGYNPLYPKLLFALLSSLTSVLVVFLGEMFFNFTVGIFAGVISAVSFNTIILSGVNNTEALYSFFLVGFFYFLLKNEKKLNRVIAGFFATMALFTRSEFFLLLLFTMLWEVYIRTKTAGKLKNLLLPYILVLTCMVPWMVRNYVFMGNYNRETKNSSMTKFVPLTLNGPLNFYIGNNKGADGGFNVSFLKRSGSNAVSQLDLVNNGYRIGISFIVDNPLLALQICKRKIARYLGGLSGGYFLQNYPAGFPGTRKSTAEIYTSNNQVMIFIHMILLIGGIIISFKKFPLSKILLLPSAASLVTSVLFFGLARTAAPYLYFYSIFFAVLPAWGMERLVVKLANIFNSPLRVPYLSVEFFKGINLNFSEKSIKNILFACILSVSIIMALLEMTKKHVFYEQFSGFSSPIRVRKR